MDDDRNLLHEMASRLMAENPAVREKARMLRGRPDVKAVVEGVHARMGVALEGFAEGAGEDEELALETIVVRTERPVLLVQNDDYEIKGPETETWKPRLDGEGVRAALRRVIPAVGRIEVEFHPTYTWVGTGWLVAEDVVVTNRHVAELFAVASGQKFTFRRGYPDPKQKMRARIDFKEEFRGVTPSEFVVEDVLHIEGDDGPDLALLKVARQSGAGRVLGPPLAMSAGAAQEKEFVATIGYPASDSRIPDQDLVRSLFGDVYDVKRLAPGQVLRPRDGLVLHDCSTLGGNSGSPIVNLGNGEVVGLHYSGLFLRENRGVPIGEVRSRLERRRHGHVVAVPDVAAGAGGSAGGAGDGGAAIRVTATAGDTHKVRLDLSVPIEVSVRVGPVRVTDSSGAAISTSSAGRAGGVPRSVEAAAEQLGAQLEGDANVLTVRPGYVFRNGWITDEPAVIVNVRDEEAAAQVPSRVGAFPVVVRPAGPSDYVEAMDLLEALEGFPPTTYKEPTGAKLKAVEEKMKVTCHVSPDAGWPTLRDFLAATKKRLTIAMYDFTAPHIIDGVLEAVKQPPRKLTMVLQAKASVGGKSKKHDRPEEQTIERYRDELGDRFDFEWASVGKNHRFASAYHIKVAVRDGGAIWLSSGNWQSSNQPPLDEVAKDGNVRDLLLNNNREWHVVIENENLAGQFEKYIRHDLAQAKQDVDIEAAELPLLEFLVEAEVPELPPGAARAFAPRVLDKQKKVRVQPLLTPDNYARSVVDLIKGAQEEILFQNQSFSILKEGSNDARFEELFGALLKKQKSGVKVWIIIRGEFEPERYVEALKQRGFDTNRIRLQDRCHTKGIVVDKKRVLVGSHNWTNQGTCVNRDASLIFDDADVAKYYADLFWFDWKNLARKSVGGRRRVRPADENEATPAGMERITLQEALLG